MSDIRQSVIDAVKKKITSGTGLIIKDADGTYYAASIQDHPDMIRVTVLDSKQSTYHKRYRYFDVKIQEKR